MEKREPNIKAIFDEALEIASPGERNAYLDKACAGVPLLRPRVELLLRAYQEAGSFLEKPVVEPAVTDDYSPYKMPQTSAQPPLQEQVGSRIGPYKLLQEIGEGGMGTVFMAEQAQPVKRLVAIKIIKAGMDSKCVIARFEGERQALALMEHPNIAKVLDAGRSELGHPYFVMELVKRVPLTQYCDSRQLSVGERLRIFQQVCHAVQHAHQKGIIHRDLKPS